MASPSLLKRPVYLSAMPDTHNGNKVFVIVNSVNYPVITLPDTPQAGTFNLFNASWPRCLRQVFNSLNNRLKISLWQSV
jgi:hypothetical protein